MTGSKMALRIASCHPIHRRRFLTEGVAALNSFALACKGLLAAPLGGQLSAGVAKTKVTPFIWVPYLTSSGAGSHAPFKGVHDDLYARALVLDDDRTPLAVLAVDSIGYDNALLGPGRDFTGELRRQVAAATGLSAGAVMLAATHVHSAPETIGLSPFRETPGVSKWVEEHLKDLVAVVMEAWGKRVPVRAYAGATKVPGVGRYRRVVLNDGTVVHRGPLPPKEKIAVAGVLDEDLAVLYLETAQGRPHGLLLNYTAHPVVTMLLPLVSADYPGAASAFVEAAWKGAVCLFTQGAGGNINTLQVTTSYEDAEVIGRKLGQAALAEVDRLKAKGPLATYALRVLSEQTVLQGRECPSVKEAEQAVAKEPTPKNKMTLRLARKLAEGPIRAEVQAMSLGPVKWVSLPGEAFVETGLALK